MRKLSLLVLLSAVSLLADACGKARAFPVLPDGGDFVLTDHNGQRFELASLRGKAVLLFFGYTTCPDICPTTLSKISEVYRQIGSDSKRVKTLYITVDPDRDTPAVLKDVLSNYEIDALGLTGTRDEIDKVVALYKAQYKIVPTPESAAKYTIEHTATLYALDPAGRTRVEFPYDAKLEEIVAGLKAILANGT